MQRDPGVMEKSRLTPPPDITEPCLERHQLLSLLEGSRRLLRAFSTVPTKIARRDEVLIVRDQLQPPALLICSGVAFQSLTMPDGRRSIIDLLFSGDIAGINHAVVNSAAADVVAANTVSYRALPDSALRELMSDPDVSMRIVEIMTERQNRADRHALVVGQFEARERIGAALLETYERLRVQIGLNHPSFNLPLTQEQLADYFGMTVVHVSRTLRRLREENLVTIDRQFVDIVGFDDLRRLVGSSADAGSIRLVRSTI